MIRSILVCYINYDIATQLKPNYAEVYYKRGLAKYALKHIVKAKQDFQTALKLAEQIGNESLKAKIESAIRDLD